MADKTAASKKGFANDFRTSFRLGRATDINEGRDYERSENIARSKTSLLSHTSSVVLRLEPHSRTS